MKKNFKYEKEKFKNGDVTNYGKKMSVLALQALIGVASIAVSAATFSNDASVGEFGIFAGMGLTTVSIGRMIHTYKYHKDFQEYIDKRKGK